MQLETLLINHPSYELGFNTGVQLQFINTCKSFKILSRKFTR